MSLSKDDLKWIIPGVVALALLVLACLPIAGCPACSGACAVVGSINGEKIVCGYCEDRRISPIR